MSEATVQCDGGSTIDMIRELLNGIDREIRGLRERNAMLETMVLGLKGDYCMGCRRYGIRKSCEECVWHGIEEAVSG